MYLMGMVGLSLIPMQITRIVGGTLVVFLPLAIAWLIVQSQGTVMNSGDRTLRFPTAVWRRTVSLDDIHDANCQVVYKTALISIIDAFNKPKRQSRPKRQYAVNLSGEFGSRQLRFGSKKRRDQFLSVLREYTHCRVTRWT